jgi:hypothetical protein
MIFVQNNTLAYLALFAGVLAVSFVPFISRVSTWFVTIVHEIGHALTALVLQGRIVAIRLHSDGGGDTQTSHHVNPLYKIVRIIELFAGYSFPIYLGASLIVSSVLYNNSTYGTVVLLAIGLITLIFLRNWFGLIILFVYFSVFSIFWVTRLYLNEDYFIAFMGGVFLVKGLADLVTAAIQTFDNGSEAWTDFHFLEDEYFFSAKFWYVCFILVQICLIIAFFHFVPIDIQVV